MRMSKMKLMIRDRHFCTWKENNMDEILLLFSLVSLRVNP